MADHPIDSGEHLDEALEQARQELDAMRVAASEAEALEGTDEHSTIHEVEEVGRYAVPREAGWKPLLALVNDYDSGLGFSPEFYPLFDKTITEHFDEELLTNQAGLPENIAAIRNFLMQTYYTETPEGMTPEKARQSLKDIGVFVGTGLSNHRKQQGISARFELGKPLIDAVMASAGDGAGVQYLYEKIHETHRQSDWIRPFSAIVALFGGHVTEDWMLPDLADTPFSPWFRENLDAVSVGDNATPEEIDAAMLYLDTLEEKHKELQEQLQASTTATDLDVIGDHLLVTADQLNEVTSMSEPVRRDAVEIAKDILRKLRVSLGEIDPRAEALLVENGELTALGGIRAVVEVYKRLLAWGRGIDPTILQHPSIVAATKAIGQIGYLAKMESVRMALKAGNQKMVQQLQQDLDQIPPHYKNIQEKNFGAVLDRVERGIDTVLNRVQNISGPGAAVGHSPAKELGNYMGGTPIAGTAMQVQADGVGNDTGKEQAAIQDRMQAANRAQAQRVTQQIANQQRQSSNSAQPRSNGSAQINALKQRLAQARRSSTTNQQANTAARNNAAARNAWNALHAHDDDHHHHQGPPPGAQQQQMGAAIAKIDPRLMSNIKQMNTMTAGLTNMSPVTGKQAFDKMRQANTYGLKPSATPAPAKTDADKKKQQEMTQPPPPPKDKGGRGI